MCMKKRQWQQCHGHMRCCAGTVPIGCAAVLCAALHCTADYRWRVPTLPALAAQHSLQVGECSRLIAGLTPNCTGKCEAAWEANYHTCLAPVWDTEVGTLRVLTQG